LSETNVPLFVSKMVIISTISCLSALSFYYH
jgi:hypothetical protein